jgi:hypothetical protein
MTIHKSRMQRQGRDRKQTVRFFVTIGLLTVLLMLILYLIYS